MGSQKSGTRLRDFNFHFLLVAVYKEGLKIMMTRFEKFISFSWKCPREDCWSALCPCSDSKTQVPSSPSSVIAWLLVVLGIELVERPNSMEEACLPLKNGRGSTDLFMSHFVREWITVPPNQKRVQGSVMPAWTAMSKQQHQALVERDWGWLQALSTTEILSLLLCGIPGTPLYGRVSSGSAI